MKYMSNNFRQEEVDMIEQMILVYKKVHGPDFSRSNYVTECMLGWTRHLLEKMADVVPPKPAEEITPE